MKKEREKIEKQLYKWQKKLRDMTELKAEVKQFIEKIPYHEIAKIEYKKQLNKQRKEVYNCQGIIQEKSEVIAQEMAQSGKFILATNVLNSEELLAEEMLSDIRHNNLVNGAFDFLKTPYF